MGDTLNIQGNVFVDNLKAKDTLVAVTIQKSQAPQTIWDNSTFKILFPIFVTLFIFFLGQLLTVYFKKRDRKTQLQNSKTSLETWVLQLEETVQPLVQHCNEFSIELAAQTYMQRVTLKYTPTLINKISELNVTDFLNYSTLNLVGSDVDNAARAFDIIHQIEFLKNVEADIKKHYDIFTTTVDNLMDRWNVANSELEKLKLNMFHEVANDETHIAYKFSHTVNDFFNNWYAAKYDYKSVKVWDEKFISPFFELLHNEIYENPKNTYPSMFADKTQALREILLNWDITQEGYSDLIKEYGDGYQQSYNTLRQDISHLRVQELVNVWRIR